MAIVDWAQGTRWVPSRSAQAAGVRPAPINGPFFLVSGPMSGSRGVDLVGPRPCSFGARQGKSFPTFALAPRGRSVVAWPELTGL